MLRYHKFFKGLMVANDLLLLTLSWWLAFWLRLHTNLISVPEVYVLRHHVIAWLLILPTWGVVFACMDLYRRRRNFTHLRETVDIIKGSSVVLFILLDIMFLLHDIIVSRFVAVSFLVC